MPPELMGLATQALGAFGGSSGSGDAGGGQSTENTASSKQVVANKSRAGATNVKITGGAPDPAAGFSPGLIVVVVLAVIALVLIAVLFGGK